MEAGGVIHWQNGAAWYRQPTKFVIDDVDATPPSSSQSGAYAGAEAPSAFGIGSTAAQTTSVGVGGTSPVAGLGEHGGVNGGGALAALAALVAVGFAGSVLAHSRAQHGRLEAALVVADVRAATAAMRERGGGAAVPDAARQLLSQLLRRIGAGSKYAAVDGMAPDDDQAFGGTGGGALAGVQRWLRGMGVGMPTRFAPSGAEADAEEADAGGYGYDDPAVVVEKTSWEVDRSRQRPSSAVATDGTP